MAESRRLRFAVLGPMRAWRDDQELRLGPPQQQAVLAAILLREGVQVSASEIIDEVWGDEAPASADHVVRSYVYRLRKVLGTGESPKESAIVSVAQGYLMRTGPDSLDLAAFRAGLTAAQDAVRKADHAAAVKLYDDALGLWAGTALAGISGAFAERQRLHLETARLTAQEGRAVAQLELGDYSQADVTLARLVDEHPLNERFRELRMLLLYRHGRQSDALALYRETQELLDEELGVDPGHGLRSLHERILQADPALMPGSEPVRVADKPDADTPDVQVPEQLPADLRSFVGRSEELAAVDALLPDDPTLPGPRAVVVTGMAGVGKTSFAVRWAHRIADRYPDGQVTVNLRGFDPARPTLTQREALTAVFDSLGVRPGQVPGDLDRQAAYLRNLVAGKRILFLFDNVRDADQVRPLLPGVDTCLVIVTSRNQLRGLAVLDEATVVELDVMPSEDAVSLLARRLGGLSSTAASAELEAIVDRCGRLPLAIAVVAARVATGSGLSLTEAIEELGREQQLLDALSDVDAVADIRSVFSWSLQALSPKAADLFRLLALNRALSWDEPAAASLIGVPVPAVRQLLAELVSANLVIPVRRGQYSLHDLVRLYSAELADALAPAVRRAGVHRLLDYYAASAQQAETVLNPYRQQVDQIDQLPGVVPEEFADHDQAWAWFVAQREALEMAQSLAVDEGFDDHVWRIGWAVQTVLYRTGHWQLALDLELAALPAADRLGDPVVQAETHGSLGKIYTRMNEFDLAWQHLNRSVDLFLGCGQEDRAASEYVSLGNLSTDMGNVEQAIGYYRKVLGLGACDIVRAMALNNLGNEYTKLGEHEQALPLVLQALELFAGLGDRHGEASTRDSIGYAYHRLGQYAEAAGAYRQAIAMFDELGDVFNRALTLRNLGDCRAEAGHPQEARSHWREAIQILTGLDHPGAEELRERLKDLQDA
jgi:DNA-binding SARP family transcriptional activator